MLPVHPILSGTRATCFGALLGVLPWGAPAVAQAPAAQAPAAEDAAQRQALEAELAAALNAEAKPEPAPSPAPASAPSPLRLLDLSFDPHTSAWELDSDGTWSQATSPDDDPMRNLQETLISVHKRRRSRLA